MFILNKLNLSIIFLFIVLLIQKLTLESSTTANATLTYSVNTISVVDISASPGPLDVTTAVPGQQPDMAIDSTTTYSISSNMNGQRITGRVNPGIPPDIHLCVTLTPPSGATSAGLVELTTSDQDLVTGIDCVSATNLPISYGICPTTSAMPQGPTNVVVTYTIGP